MRLLHVVSDLDVGGAEIMLAKLVSMTDKTRFNQIVVSLTDRGRLGEQIESYGVPVHVLGMKRGRPNLVALARLVRLVKQYKPDIVHSWLYHADLISTAAVRLVEHPVLAWNIRCSDMDLRYYRPLTRWILRMLTWLSRIPRAVVVNSEAGREQHHAMGYRPRRWEVIPNGFDVDQFRPDAAYRAARRAEWNLSDDSVAVALIARVDPMKDHETFLDAARQVSALRRDIHFVLIGKGTEQLREGVEARGLRDQVRLLGYRSEIQMMLPGIDIVCLSSAFGEGFPNILGEAMACGVPCISTDVGDARRIIAETGLIVQPRDAGALGRAILDLADRGVDARRALGRQARQRIEAEYSLMKIVRQYESFYSSLVTCAPV